MKVKPILLLALTVTLLSFSGDKREIEFKYPKNKEAKFTMTTNMFKKFTEEWRGQDYYYLCENDGSNMICSVLFYKLNQEEQKAMVEPFGGTPNAGIPFAYFSENSNLKKYEKNNINWGAMTDDFMFRQNDIIEMEGMKVNQKNMYAYAMFGTDLFVNVHLSKINYTAGDSIAMKEILNSLSKKK